MQVLSQSKMKKAHTFYRQWFNKTPIEYSKILSDYLQTPAILKLENMHVSGSFELRMAHYHLSQLSEEETKRGLVIPSSGYFGLAYAYVCFMHSIECHILCNEKLSPFMKEKFLGYDAIVHHKKASQGGSIFGIAKEFAASSGHTLITRTASKTYALTGAGFVQEVLEDIPQACTFLMPHSTYGFIDGAKKYLETLGDGFNMICAHREKTEPSSESLFCSKRFDSAIKVTETEQRKALQWLFKHHQILAEPKGLLALAALLKKPKLKLDGPLCIVLSNRYLSPNSLKSLM